MLFKEYHVRFLNKSIRGIFKQILGRINILKLN